jgi:glyoxylase-like metal-dependent hydrolase (beta-lactamase superfamily II)
MRVQELQPGLWRWSGLHPEWKTGDDWEQEVWCVYYEGPEEIVLVDPLVPPEESERFWDALDGDIKRLGRPVAVVLTCAWHRRSADAIAARYGVRVGGELPVGVEVFPVEPYEEAPVWIPEHHALVLGDVLMGPRLQVPPMTWVPEKWRGERYTEPLRFLLDLPVELVLPSHGEPATSDDLDAVLRPAGPAR